MHGIERNYAMLPSFMLLNDSCAIFPFFCCSKHYLFPKGLIQMSIRSAHPAVLQVIPVSNVLVGLVNSLRFIFICLWDRNTIYVTPSEANTVVFHSISIITSYLQQIYQKKIIAQLNTSQYSMSSGLNLRCNQS